MYYSESPAFSPGEVLVYLRKSRSDDPLLSVEEVLNRHEKILDEWAERYMGEKVPEENKYREIVSGETIENRPEIQKILRLVENPKYKAVLTVEVQRLSRGDLEDAGRLMKLLRFTKTCVITPQKIYDLSNEYDRDLFERELKRGNEYLEYTKKIMLRGRLAAVKEGHFIGNRAPYGYKKTVVMQGKRKCHTLIPDDEEAKVVRMIFDMYVNEDLGRVTIASRLNSMGIKPPVSERWTQDSIKTMLSNEHYLGKVVWNKRKTVSVVEDGEIIVKNPRSAEGEYLVFDGLHEAIVDEKIFKEAKEKCGRCHRAKPQTTLRNPFAGLVQCRCGKAMTFRTYLKNGMERSAPRLICNAQPYCKTSSCLFEEMKEEVEKILCHSIADFEVRMKLTDEENAKRQGEMIKTLEEKLEELGRKEIKQWEKYSEEEMPKHIFDKLNEKVLKEKEEVERNIYELKKNLADPEYCRQKIRIFREALDALRDDNTSAEEKNKLLKSCIEKITYNREKSERVKKDEQPDLPVGGRWTSPPITLDVKLKL